MINKILLSMAVIIGGLLIVIATRPSDFQITRTATMHATPAEVFAQVNDFHKWQAWSPWAKLDPNAKTVYEGPSAGPGAIFRWAGNDQIGEGSETIVESRPNELIRITLEFIKPFKGTNTVEFTFKPEGPHTTVTWSMFGKDNFIGKAMDLLMDRDKLVGGQFEQGLADLKSVVQSK